ncbi:alcohol oxidase [Amylostereum chailletii]|nr:alcohol oxidase [Amylostereum chailletii]
MGFILWFTKYPETKVSELAEEYDYIIVGGGTAGCVLANRLSAGPSNRVLLLEQGPVADTWASRVPLLSSDFASDGSRTLRITSEYQQEINQDRVLYVGKALGGSSRINAMLYTRGLPAEYDAWEAAGRDGWGWKDLKPYFLKSEHANYACDPDVHNTKGEWHNSDGGDLAFSGFEHTKEACRAVGLPYIGDLNSPDHPSYGCGRIHLTRDDHARRHSTFHAFIPKSLALERRGRLHICTNSTVSRLEIDNETSGRHVVRGVVITSANGTTKTVRAAKEVVLSAGPFGSPRVLMLSGVGPVEHLKEHGIKVIKDLPAVGSNLQDHFGVSVSYDVPMKESLLALEKRPWVFIIELFRYLLFGTGLLLAPVLQMAIFTSSAFLDSNGLPTQMEKVDDKTLPDVEIMPMAYDTGDGFDWDKKNGVYSFLCVLLRPKSKGTVRLASSDPADALRIDPRFLSNPDDFAPLRACVRLSLRLRDRMRAQGYTLRDWRSPEAEDDASLDTFIRGRNRTTYHYSSTCRMAPEHDAEGGGVVDDRLNVHGFANLRIADSSVFPWIPATHLQAPTVAVAEKCADLMLGK